MENQPNFENMTEAEILAWAARSGYTQREAPTHYASPGHRIGGASRPDDPTMSAANRRLWEIQNGRKL